MKEHLGPERIGESDLAQINKLTDDVLVGKRETTLDYTKSTTGEVVVPDLEKGLTPLEGYHDTKTFHGFGNRDGK